MSKRICKKCSQELPRGYRFQICEECTEEAQIEASSKKLDQKETEDFRKLLTVTRRIINNLKKG